jgi:HK97 family phage major capsid protein
MKHTVIETRDDTGADPIAAAVATIEELRTTVTGSATETRTAVEAVRTDLAALRTRVDAIEVRSQRPGAAAGGTSEPPIERRAFTGFLRGGREILTPDEVRTLRVADDSAGGYLAPTEFVAEVIKGVVQFSPVRQVATVRTTSAGSVTLPRRTGTITGRWVDETETRTGTEETYGQAVIPIREAAFYIDVSTKLLEDAAVNIEAELSMDAAEEAGRLEGDAFLNGDGVKEPAGILSDSGIAYTASGGASDFAASNPGDALITLMYALPATYRNTGTWMMNGSTLAKVRKFKDGQGNYLWSPAYTAGQPETILGRPVVEAPDMPDVGSNTFPVIFGDFARAYRIYDRLALSVLRDPYSLATSGKVRFHFRRRTGGGVVLAEALRKLKIATS